MFVQVLLAFLVLCGTPQPNFTAAVTGNQYRTVPCLQTPLLLPKQAAVDATLRVALNPGRPRCTSAGHSAPVQCCGSTGYCWCVTPNGKVVPGTIKRGHPQCNGGAPLTVGHASGGRAVSIRTPSVGKVTSAIPKKVPMDGTKDCGLEAPEAATGDAVHNAAEVSAEEVPQTATEEGSVVAAKDGPGHPPPVGHPGRYMGIKLRVDARYRNIMHTQDPQGAQKATQFTFRWKWHVVMAALFGSVYAVYHCLGLPYAEYEELI